MKRHLFRNIARLNQIGRVLIKYGFGGIVSEIKLLPVFSIIAKLPLFSRVGRKMTVPVRVRRILEELGPTFIKLGQAVSTRADLFPAEWIEELKKLQDSVPPVSFDKVREAVEGSFGETLETKFKSFDEVPIASASIAQVHFAELKDGTPVAVKVKRPNIERIIGSDISVMYTVARLLVRHIPAARRYKPVKVVDEFKRVIENELDLTIEGANAIRFLKMFERDDKVLVPKVYWSYTNKDVLTLERVSGIPFDEIERIKAAGLDCEKIAVNGIKAFFRQVFEFGFYHADLHPGNIFATEGNAIIYLDFGIVGRLDPKLRNYMASMLYYVVRQDYRRLAIVHKDMGLIGKGVDVYEFECALRDIGEPIFGQKLEEINISTFLVKLVETAKRYEMTLQPNLLLLQKSMVIIEGVGRQLYPNIDMWSVAKPLVYRWMAREKLSPGVYAEKARDFTGELASTLSKLPGQMQSVLEATLNDELKVGFVHHRLDGLTREIKGAGRRIGGGFIVAVLVGCGFITAMAGSEIENIFELPLMSYLAFGAALVIGFVSFRNVGNNVGDDAEDREG